MEVSEPSATNVFVRNRDALYLLFIIQKRKVNGRHLTFMINALHKSVGCTQSSLVDYLVEVQVSCLVHICHHGKILIVLFICLQLMQLNNIFAFSSALLVHLQHILLC